MAIFPFFLFSYFVVFFCFVRLFFFLLLFYVEYTNPVESVESLTENCLAGRICTCMHTYTEWDPRHM